MEAAAIRGVQLFKMYSIFHSMHFFHDKPGTALNKIDNLRVCYFVSPVWVAILPDKVKTKYKIIKGLFPHTPPPPPTPHHHQYWHRRRHHHHNLRQHWVAVDGIIYSNFEY